MQERYKLYCDINIVYQTTKQLRNIEQLNLQNPPMVYPLQLKGLKRNADGLYLMSDVNARFLQAIRTYDKIEDSL